MTHTPETLPDIEPEKPLDHVWREAPAAQGCKEVCQNCGCKDISREAQFGCVLLPETTKPRFSSAQDYDPYA